MDGYRLERLGQDLGVVRYDRTAPVPDWAFHEGFWSVTRTDRELSIVGPWSLLVRETNAVGPWSGFHVSGELDFTQVGVLKSICAPLAEFGISVFVISTFDTDYVLVRQEQFKAAIKVLNQAGHTWSE